MTSFPPPEPDRQTIPAARSTGPKTGNDLIAYRFGLGVGIILAGTGLALAAMGAVWVVASVWHGLFR